MKNPRIIRFALIFLIVMAPLPISGDTFSILDTGFGSPILNTCTAFTGESDVVIWAIYGPEVELYYSEWSLLDGDLSEIQSEEQVSHFSLVVTPSVQGRIYGNDNGDFFFFSEGSVAFPVPGSAIFTYKRADGFASSFTFNDQELGFGGFPISGGESSPLYFPGAKIIFNSDSSKFIVAIVDEEDDLIAYAFTTGTLYNIYSSLFQQALGNPQNFIFCEVQGDPMYVGYEASHELMLYRFSFEDEDSTSAQWTLSGLSSDLKLQDCMWGSNDKFYVYFINTGVETDDFKNDIIYYYETDDPFEPETDQNSDLLPPKEIDLSYLRTIPNRIEVMPLESGGAIMTGDFIDHEEDSVPFIWRLDEDMIPLARPYGVDVSVANKGRLVYGTMDFKDNLVLISLDGGQYGYLNFAQICESDDDCEDSTYDNGRNFCDPRRKICTKGPCDEDSECTQFPTAPTCSNTRSHCYDIRINFPQEGVNVCIDEYLTVQMLLDVPVKANWTILDSNDTNAKVQALEAFLNEDNDGTINIPLDLLTYSAHYELQAVYEEDTATYTLDTFVINMLSHINPSLVCDCSSANYVNTIQRICSTTESWIFVHEIAKCGITIEAQFSDDAGGPDITWVYYDQSPTGSDNGLNIELEKYLEAQTTYYVVIPAGYLQPALTYTFRFTYLEIGGGTKIVEEDVGPSENVVLYRLGDYASGPYVDFCYKSDCSGISDEDEYHYQWFAQPIFTYCLEDTSLITYKWVLSEPSNPPAELQTFMNQQNQQILEIPECFLEPGTTYNFHAEVQFDYKGDPIVLDSFDLITQPLEYQISLQGGNTYHHPNQDLDIRILYPLKGEGCPDDPQIKEDLLFHWSCEIENEDDCTNPCPCDDPDNLFDVDYTEVTNLTVPSSYFSPNDWVIIKVVFDDNSIDPLETRTKMVGEIFEVDLQCVSGKCVKYDQDNEYVFSASPINDGTLEGVVNNQWNIEPSTFPVVDYLDRFKIRSQSINTVFSTVEVEVIVTVGDKSGYKRLTMEPETEEPSSLVIFPTEGVSLIDVFTFDARGFEDSDRPLSFDFQYQRVGIDNDFVSFGILKKKSIMQTKLFGQNPQLTINIKAMCIDFFGSTTEQTTEVEVSSGTIDQVNSAIQTYLTELDDTNYYDLDDQFQKYNMAVTQAFNINQEIIGDDDTVCEECSGNGECLNENIQKCTCEDGWGLKNCALTQSQVESLRDNLATIINVLYEDFSISATNINQLTSVLKMVEESSTITARSFVAMSQVQEILDSVLLGTETGTRLLVQEQDDNGFWSLEEFNATNKRYYTQTRKLQSALTYDLTPDQTQSALIIINNLIDYLKEIQCQSNETTTYGQNIFENIADYASIIAEVNLQDLAPGDDAIILTSRNLDILSQRFPECDFDGQILDLGEDSISIQLFRKAHVSCSNENTIGVELFAINHNFFNCDSDKIYKNITGLRLTNDTKHVVNKDYTGIIRTAEGVECPNQCDPKDKDGNCICNDLTLFDVKDQFQVLLSQSNLFKLYNIQSLSNWEFYKSATFYILIGATIFTGIYGIFVLTKVKKTCIVNKVIEKDEASGCERTTVIMLSGHPLITAALYLDKDVGKMVRLMTFYTRVVLFHFYASLFMTEGNINSTVNSDVNLMPESNPYFILLPYVTIIPVNLILITLISQKSEYKNKKGEIIPTPNTTKIKVIFGYILLLCVMAGSIFGSFVIDSQNSSSERTRVIVLYIQAMVQDQLITPILVFGLQIGALSLLLIDKLNSKGGVRKIVTAILQNNFKKTIGFPLEKGAPLDEISVYVNRICKKRAPNSRKQQSIPTDVNLKLVPKVSKEKQSEPSPKASQQKEVKIELKSSEAKLIDEEMIADERSELNISSTNSENESQPKPKLRTVTTFKHNLNSIKTSEGLTTVKDLIESKSSNVTSQEQQKKSKSSEENQEVKSKSEVIDLDLKDEKATSSEKK